MAAKEKINQQPKICPECGKQMHKAGKAWSGRKKVQRWKCNHCGRSTIT